MAVLEEIYEGVLDGEMDTVTVQVQKAMDEGLDAAKILNEGLIGAMGEVGRLFEEGEFFVPEMLVAARAMKAGVELLRPKLLEADIKPLGKAIMATVKGDLHDIGKNLVSLMLEGAGFEVIDFGTDAPPEKLVAAVKDNEAQFLGLSALLTTTMPAMKATVEALKEAGVRDNVKVMVGGAPVTQAFADEIGADLYAPDGPSAARKAKEMLAAA